MSRAVFMSACGDPFIALFAMKLWKERWYNEVDKFYICYNNHAGVPIDVAGEFLQRASQDKKVHLLYHPNGIGNGMPITEMALIAKEDLVMLLEDDGFIFAPGEVDSAFKQIENGHVDAIGSPRGSCGQEITDAVCKKYNLDISGYGDRGVNYWPNFFFCKRADLLATDMNFGSKEFTAGVYYPELDHTMTETQYADTFVWADLQMRKNGVRFGHVPQHHANPSDIEQESQQRGMWGSPKARWIHGGSLSAGWGGYLSGPLPDVSTDSSKQEIESRVAFWEIAWSTIDGFSSFKNTYGQGIENLVSKAQLDLGRIAKKVYIYGQLMQV